MRVYRPCPGGADTGAAELAERSGRAGRRVFARRCCIGGIGSNSERQRPACVRQSPTIATIRHRPHKHHARGSEQFRHIEPGSFGRTSDGKGKALSDCRSVGVLSSAGLGPPIGRRSLPVGCLGANESALLPTVPAPISRAHHLRECPLRKPLPHSPPAYTCTFPNVNEEMTTHRDVRCFIFKR